MNVFDLFDPAACDIRWRWSDMRTWEEYSHNQQELTKKWIDIVLVDMINHPVENAIPISNEMFFENQYPENTVFCLYCHSGGSSWYVQKQLKQKLWDKYTFINMKGWMYSYNIWKDRN